MVNYVVLKISLYTNKIKKDKDLLIKMLNNQSWVTEKTEVLNLLKKFSLIIDSNN